MSAHLSALASKWAPPRPLAASYLVGEPSLGKLETTARDCLVEACVPCCSDPEIRQLTLTISGAGVPVTIVGSLGEPEQPQAAREPDMAELSRGLYRLRDMMARYLTLQGIPLPPEILVQSEMTP